MEPAMHRRTLLALAGGLLMSTAAHAQPYRRVRPGEAGWPSADGWKALDAQLGGRLVAIKPPLEACRAAPQSAECAAFFRGLKNPWAVGDDPALTQTSGWAGAWAAASSSFAVAARDANDVAAAVSFARTHRLRLVVKGGGHSYQGTSNAADSLLVWTRRMQDVTMHDAFVPAGCAGLIAPQRAVSCGAGALWAHLYDAVTTRGGGYVQGGGCMTVG